MLVHGGSAEANSLGEALGYPPRFITSPSGFTSRYTDRRTLEIFAMAVNGKVNSLLVEQLQTLGVNALGLSGLDGRLMLAARKDAIQSVENGKRKVIRDDYTGKIETDQYRLAGDSPGSRLHAGDRPPGGQPCRRGPQRGRRPRRSHAGLLRCTPRRWCCSPPSPA